MSSPSSLNNSRLVRLNRRAWYRQYFVDHPGYKTGDPCAFSGMGTTRDKVKVWCAPCLDRCTRQILLHEYVQVTMRVISEARSEAEVHAECKLYILLDAL